MNPLLAQFVTEARDFLQSIGESLMQLERCPNDSELIGELFRLVHTLKGNSGLFEFQAMTNVLHAAEDLMDAIRDKELDFAPEIADQLLDAMDFVAQLIDDIAQDRYNIPHYTRHAAQIATSLRSYLSGTTQSAHTEPDASVEQGQLTSPSVQTGYAIVIDQRIRRAFNQVPSAILASQTPEHFFIVYQPEPECFFKGEDPFHLMLCLPELLWGATLYTDDPRVDSFDCYRSSAAYIAFSRSTREELEQHFRYVPEQVCITTVAEHTGAAGLHSTTHSTTDSSSRPKLDTALLGIIETQRQILTLKSNAPWALGRITAVLNTLGAVLTGHEPYYSHFTGLSALVKNSENIQPMVDWLDSLMSSNEESVHTEEALGTTLTSQPAAPTADIETQLARDLHEQTEVLTPTPSQETDVNFGRRAEDAQASKVLKVEQGKIDRLMDLIGEIVVAKNGLPYLASKAEDQYGVRELAKEIKMQYSVINRIAEELQDAIMQVRMMPVSFIFQRFPRLVRDIARKLGKEVDLVIEGEDTEADKNIIEALADPLIHILRNSLDHGLELPDVRQSRGKPRVGRLHITASQESDRVVIQVKDDGKGIDPVIIKQKAYEKRIINEDQLEKLNDREAIQLIFAAGFSTAEQVTDLSGRGVGMDVVRTAIQKIGGQVRLDSEVNKGTSLTLYLPLSMAVTNVMVIASDSQIFGIPMDLVVETVRLPASAIQSIKQQRTTLLRGKIIPLISLNTVLGLDKAQQKNEEDEFALLVVKSQGEVLGLLVDDFSEVIDIILKPLPGELAKMPIYSGSALLGDGSVLLVLNPQEFA
uniref:chemotaxis protein CheA n=1 Tax=Cellvibrio fontiphilus TaxID=1815559 RepID=UPI002B4BE1C3|nr:chemotaxis protein CheA [Cellvibrio fontiphilus]